MHRHALLGALAARFSFKHSWSKNTENFLLEILGMALRYCKPTSTSHAGIRRVGVAALQRSDIPSFRVSSEFDCRGLAQRRWADNALPVHATCFEASLAFFLLRPNENLARKTKQLIILQPFRTGEHLMRALIASIIMALPTIALAEPTLALKLSPLNWERLAEQDSGAIKGQVYRIAVPVKVGKTIENSGEWIEHGDQSIWRLPVDAIDAVHLNFGFDLIQLSPGATLRIVDENGKVALGPYRASDIAKHGQLWTPLMPGARAQIELQLPKAERMQVNLRLAQVGQGYRGFGFTNHYERSGACNMDVACLDTNDWSPQRRSVGRILISGNGLCTGALINNTSNDRRLLFATAAHCGVQASNGAQVVAYFNYESAACRTPGSAASGNSIPAPTTTLQSTGWLGGTSQPFTGLTPAPSGLTAQRSDWSLIELGNSATIASLNLFLAGWDKGTGAPVCTTSASSASTAGQCASIHHPNGDEKRITFSDTTMSTGNISSATSAHWFVRWDAMPPSLPNIPLPVPSPIPAGVTEQGSSGSPLFNADRRIVGVLSGGPSFCGATGTSLADYYGKLAVAFNGTLVAGSQNISTLLDPGSVGTAAIDGIEFNASTGDNIFRNGFE
jgi:lysyl endopeptidase